MVGNTVMVHRLLGNLSSIRQDNLGHTWADTSVIRVKRDIIFHPPLFYLIIWIPLENNNKYHRMSKSLIICWWWWTLSSIELRLVREDPIWRSSWHCCTINLNNNITFISFVLKIFSKIKYKWLTAICSRLCLRWNKASWWVWGHWIRCNTNQCM